MGNVTRSSIGSLLIVARRGTRAGNIACQVLNGGRGSYIDLVDLIPPGSVLKISGEEYDQAAAEYWPDVARLLEIIESITRGKWHLRVDSNESNNWRRDWRVTQDGNRQH